MFFKKEEKKLICPFLDKECLTNKCMMWTNIQGKHPQTGKDIDYWDCSFKIQNFLILEQGRQIEGLRIVNEETRNQTIKNGENLIKAAYLFHKGGILVNEKNIPVELEGKENEYNSFN